MAEPSRTVWPRWLPLPATCCECGLRVTLKQSHRTCFDEATQTGRVWHSACDPFTVSVVVTKSSQRVPEVC